MALLVFPVPTSLDRAAIVASFPVGKDSIVLQDPPESAGEGFMLPPLYKGRASCSLPFIRGGLGWGKGLRINSNRLDNSRDLRVPMKRRFYAGVPPA